VLLQLMEITRKGSPVKAEKGKDVIAKLSNKIPE
jgi:hypothetical protein